jgi:hypothetical protein
VSWTGQGIHPLLGERTSRSVLLRRETLLDQKGGNFNERGNFDGILLHG